MRKIFFGFIFLISNNASAFEAQDIVMKMIKHGDSYQVSFGSMSQIYQIKASDKNVECLEKSVKEKAFVKIEVDSKKAKILSCK